MTSMTSMKRHQSTPDISIYGGNLRQGNPATDGAFAGS